MNVDFCIFLHVGHIPLKMMLITSMLYGHIILYNDIILLYLNVFDYTLLIFHL